MKKEFINALIDNANINKDNLKDFLIHINESYDFNIEAFILSIIGKKKMLYSTCDDLNSSEFKETDSSVIYGKIVQYCQNNNIDYKTNKINVTTFYYMRQDVYFNVGGQSYYLNLLD